MQDGAVARLRSSSLAGGSQPGRGCEDRVEERIAIFYRPLFLALRWVAVWLALGRVRISVNPRTKMIVYAQKPF